MPQACTVDLNDKIPNNVGLADDPKVRRALLHWQPKYLEWWQEMGPTDFSPNDIYLRTAVSVESGGWANYDYVKMPDYRWGIFLSPRHRESLIRAGDHAGEKSWSEVPGEYRNALRRLVVTQADTEPASVEQQRMLGHTAPSLYDLRNLFQVNVEEGRHLWAMVYLLHKFFGRDGREEGDMLLERRSGDPDKPRILGTFNQPCDNWLSFFCFTMFVDRDGKYQLAALRESAFEPLARSCEFMLTEEAFHLFVGETGLRRIVRRSAQLARESPNGDPRELGGIDLPLIQRAINYWFTFCLDLFGGEISNNAAEAFACGLKGRFKEDEHYRDHRALDGVYPMPMIEQGKVVTREIPLRNAMNEVLRDEYIRDCQRAVNKWNRVLANEGSEFRLQLPNRRFHRHHGIYSNHHFDPQGNLIDQDTWELMLPYWLPTEQDRDYLHAIMQPVTEPGKFANWIAPPVRGLNGQPAEFEYVRLA